MDTPTTSKRKQGRPATGRRADDSHVIRLDDQTFSAMAEIGKPIGFSAQRVFDLVIGHYVGTEPGTMEGNIRVAIKHSLSKLTG